MKICVSSTANSLDAPIDPRFGRCPYFIIVDLETMQFEAIPNTASGAMGGAGTVSYTHLRAHETRHDLVCRLLLEKKH